ncbi:hypothetical protein P3S68_012165 [Capsicum galapagoense]
MGHELISTSQHDLVKTFSIDRFQVAMPINGPEGKQLTGGLFKKSCFGRFLELPEDPAARIRFPMTMVYGLLKRRIKCHHLEDKTIPEQYKEQLCLVWFAHSVILARDVNNVIEDNLLAHAEDFDKFNNYPRGYDNFYLTVQYLQTKLSSGTTTLYGFPWDFMAWAFEAIPPLRKQLMDYPNEVSYPRMFRWLAAKSNTNIKEADLFNPTDDSFVHPWIVPTEEESVMTSYITLGHVDTIADPMVELIKKELAGATAIRRAVRQGQPNVEALHDQPFTKADSSAFSARVVGIGSRHADAATTRDDEHVDAQERINMFENTPFCPYTGPSHPSSPLCSHCEYDECKDKQDKLFEKVESISKAIEEFKSKRCVIPSKKVREPHTPAVLVRRKKRAIRDVLSARKTKEIAIPLSPKAVEVQGPVKKVDIYTELGYVDIIPCLMRKRQLTYRKAYDATDRIMDLNFCKKLKDWYDQLNEEASTLGVGLDFLVPTLVLDEEETLRYIKGDMPNPHDKSWTEAKRILAVISVSDIHYRTIEILLEEGKINVYYSNVPLIDDFDLFLLVEPLMVLLPIFFREIKLMNYLPKKVLIKKSWDFEGRNRGMLLPKDDAAKASGSHAVAHIECLLTDIEIFEPVTFLCDNAVANLEEV